MLHLRVLIRKLERRLCVCFLAKGLRPGLITGAFQKSTEKRFFFIG